MKHFLTDIPESNNHLQVFTEQSKYVIPMDWYIKYIKYKKGGPPPGPIIVAHLLTSTNQLDPKFEEAIDYRLATHLQWTQLSKTFGKDHEVKLVTRPILRSVSSGGYEDDGFISLRDDSFIPNSTRKSIDLQSEFSLECLSKPTSLDKENSNTLYSNFIKQKVTLSLFKHSGGFNSCLLMLMSINELAEFFINTSAFGDCYHSEFLLQISLIFIAARNLHSGVIDTEFFYSTFSFSTYDPSQIIQSLVNKLELETSSSSSISSLINGELTKEVQCLVCGKSSIYITKYSYLQLNPRKSLQKSFEQYSRHVNQVNFCSNCKQEQDCCTQVKVSKFPHYLIIVLKRWENKNGNTQCSFKGKWNPGVDYRLISVISEVNKTFVNLTKKKKTWFSYEGERIKKLMPSGVFGSLPYVLLYKLAN